MKTQPWEAVLNGDDDPGNTFTVHASRLIYEAVPTSVTATAPPLRRAITLLGLQ